MKTKPISISLRLFVIFMVGLVACNSDIEDPEPQIAQWESLSSFINEQRLAVNMSDRDDGLVILTRQDISLLRTPELVDQIAHGGELSMPLPLTRDVFLSVDADPDGLTFFSTKDPVSQNPFASYFLSFKELGSTVSGLVPGFWQGLAAANHQGQIMMPLIHQDGTWSVWLFDPEISQTVVGGTTYTGPETVSGRLVSLPQIEWIESISAIEDHFYVAYRVNAQEAMTVRISTDGTVEQVLNTMISRKVFQFEGNGYALTPDANLYRSGDAGLTWELILENFREGALDVGRIFQPIYIEGQTFLYTSDRILRLTSAEGTPFGIESVNMNGLEGNTLTALAVWRDRMYATTLSGVFSIPKSEFWPIDR